MRVGESEAFMGSGKPFTASHGNPRWKQTDTDLYSKLTFKLSASACTSYRQHAACAAGLKRRLKPIPIKQALIEVEAFKSKFS